MAEQSGRGTQAARARRGEKAIGGKRAFTQMETARPRFNSPASLLSERAKEQGSKVCLLCEERMASFMAPRYFDFRESLPKTETHRIQKAQLKQHGITPATRDRDKDALVDSEHNTLRS
ncbi:hypothetical protein [Candidatus Binatus sp.]|uniref:hypothetical protein n=1 Tax=Candidatus Binatus sp. TaxID=2811406 RepID=UPI002F93DB3B